MTNVKKEIELTILDLNSKQDIDVFGNVMKQFQENGFGIQIADSAEYTMIGKPEQGNQKVGVLTSISEGTEVVEYKVLIITKNSSVKKEKVEEVKKTGGFIQKLKDFLNR